MSILKNIIRFTHSENFPKRTNVKRCNLERERGAERLVRMPLSLVLVERYDTSH